MLEQLEAHDFSPWLHQVLHIRFSPEVRLAAELVEVRAVESYTPLPRQPFAIVLRTAQQTHYYHQTVAALEHPEKGDLPIFFVPVGFDGQGMLYEAIFA